MADYDETTWVDEETKVGPTNLNNLEAGVKDAAEHNYASASRPAASAARKHHIWIDETSGDTWYCDGATWIPMGQRDQGKAVVRRTVLTDLYAGLAFVALTPAQFHAWPYVVQHDGVISGAIIRAYRDAGVTSGTLSVYVWADNAGAPGAVLWSGDYTGPTPVANLITELPSSAGTAVDVPLNGLNDLAVTAGTTVWVGVVANTVGGNVFAGLSATSVAHVKADANPAGPWVAQGAGSRLGVRLGNPASFSFFTNNSEPDGFAVVDALGNRTFRVRPDGSIKLNPSAIVSGDRWHVIGATGEPAFANSWVAAGGIDQVPRFIRDPFGFVHIEGLMSTGVVNSPAFTLPVGYRPAARHLYSVVANDAFGRMSIAADGTVRLAVGSNGFVQLSGITFQAA